MQTVSVLSSLRIKGPAVTPSTLGQEPESPLSVNRLERRINIELLTILELAHTPLTHLLAPRVLGAWQELVDLPEADQGNPPVLTPVGTFNTHFIYGTLETSVSNRILSGHVNNISSQQILAEDERD